MASNIVLVMTRTLLFFLSRMSQCPLASDNAGYKSCARSPRAIKPDGVVDSVASKHIAHQHPKCNDVVPPGISFQFPYSYMCSVLIVCRRSKGRGTGSQFPLTTQMSKTVLPVVRRAGPRTWKPRLLHLPRKARPPALKSRAHATTLSRSTPRATYISDASGRCIQTWTSPT